MNNKQLIGIINYGAGNTQSVAYALGRCNTRFIISNHADELNTCDKLIFPGVGHATHAMQKLAAHHLIDFIKETKITILGICLGMQLMCNHTPEGETKCLNIFDIDLQKFDAQKIKVPSVGWNQVEAKENILFKNIEGVFEQYFVHSFYVPDNEFSIATTNYNFKYCAAMQKDNFYGVQFHPEKSGIMGQLILNNFLSI